MNQLETITRSALYELVWSMPLTTLAKKYNITDSGLRKICNRMNIPLPHGGYWQKIKHGKRVNRVGLPSDYSGISEVKLELKTDETIPKLTPRGELKQLQIQIETELGDKLIVPQRLLRPERLVIAAKEIHDAKSKRDWSSDIFKKHPDRLDMEVSDKLFSRALLFFDTFIKTLTLRNHTVQIQNGVAAINVFGEIIEIRLREKRKAVKETKNNWTSTNYEPTGILYFAVRAWYSDKIWTDGALLIEKQLSNILAFIEIKGKELAEKSRLHEIENKRQQEIRRQKEDMKKKQDVELAKFRSLLIDVSRWQQLKLIRGYINELEVSKQADDSLTLEIQSWIEWARKKADWYDPQINGHDELLEEVDKETLTVKKTSFW